MKNGLEAVQRRPRRQINALWDKPVRALVFACFCATIKIIISPRNKTRASRAWFAFDTQPIIYSDTHRCGGMGTTPRAFCSVWSISSLAAAVLVFYTRSRSKIIYRIRASLFSTSTCHRFAIEDFTLLVYSEWTTLYDQTCFVWGSVDEPSCNEGMPVWELILHFKNISRGYQILSSFHNK